MSDDAAKSFADLFSEICSDQKAREASAEKHKCVKVCIGEMRRVSTKHGKPLKRPVVKMRFYVCKICGRTM